MRPQVCKVSNVYTASTIDGSRVSYANIIETYDPMCAYMRARIHAQMEIQLIVTKAH